VAKTLTYFTNTKSDSLSHFCTLFFFCLFTELHIYPQEIRIEENFPFLSRLLARVTCVEDYIHSVNHSRNYRGSTGSEPGHIFVYESFSPVLHSSGDI
jgi:hypothetical protein